MVSMKKNNQ